MYYSCVLHTVDADRSTVRALSIRTTPETFRARKFEPRVRNHINLDEPKLTALQRTPELAPVTDRPHNELSIANVPGDHFNMEGTTSATGPFDPPGASPRLTTIHSISSCYTPASLNSGRRF